MIYYIVTVILLLGFLYYHNFIKIEEDLTNDANASDLNRKNTTVTKYSSDTMYSGFSYVICWRTFHHAPEESNGKRLGMRFSPFLRMLFHRRTRRIGRKRFLLRFCHPSLKSRARKKVTQFVTEVASVKHEPAIYNNMVVGNQPSIWRIGTP